MHGLLTCRGHLGQEGLGVQVPLAPPRSARALKHAWWMDNKVARLERKKLEARVRGVNPGRAAVNGVGAADVLAEQLQLPKVAAVPAAEPEHTAGRHMQPEAQAPEAASLNADWEKLKTGSTRG